MPKRKIGVNQTLEKPKVAVTEFSGRTTVIAIALIFLVTLVVFWRTLKNGFTDWDDNIYVVQSDLITSLDWASFKRFFTTMTANLYTPLVTLSYAIDYKLYGLNPTGFHATNLILHLINIALVFIVTQKLFKRGYIAVITAFLFAIHPLQTETVLWVSSRKDLMFTCFYLVGIVTYLRFLETKNKGLIVLTFACFILSLLSKPIAFTFPLALLWIDYFKDRRLTRTQLISKIPFLIVSVLVGLFGIFLVHEYDVFATAPQGYSLFDKACLAAYALSFYIYNTFIPTSISNYHAYPFKVGSTLGVEFVVAPFIILLMLFLIYRGIRKNFQLVSGLILFLIVIGPTLRLLPTGYPIAADRYFYLASVGLFWSLILTFERIAQFSFPLKAVVVTVSGILSVVFVVTTYRRVPDWKDSISLWSSTLKQDPFHELANDHLGRLYDNAGRKEMALSHFQRIIARDTTKADVLNSAGNILLEKKETAMAMRYFDLAIASGKANHLPYYNRGMVYSEKGEFKKAILDFDAAIRLKDDFGEAFNNRGIAKVQSGDTLGAYNDFQQAVKFRPGDAMMQNNLQRIKSFIAQ